MYIIYLITNNDYILLIRIPGDIFLKILLLIKIKKIDHLNNS